MARSLQRYNWLIVLSLFIALAGGAVLLQTISESKAATLSEMPDQSFTTLEGKVVTLHQFKGRMVLIHFWASWCPPCIKEFPWLLQAAHDNPEIAVIAISVDRNKKDMTEFLSHINNLSTLKNVYFVHDPENKISVNGVKIYRFPETFIIKRDMTLGAHIESGLDWRRFDFEQ